MLAVFAILGVFLVAPPEGIREFRSHSNGMAEYEIVIAKPCETGLRTTGYAYAPAGGIMLKQKNLDGTVSTPVCSE